MQIAQTSLTLPIEWDLTGQRFHLPLTSIFFFQRNYMEDESYIPLQSSKSNQIVNSDDAIRHKSADMYIYLIHSYEAF